jgi:hypothetical protein
MRPNLVSPRWPLFAALLFTGALACSAAQGPEARTQMKIYGIQVPAHAASSDSIRISFFTASTSCTYSDRVIEVESLSGGGLKFAATSIPSDFCPPSVQALVPPIPVVYLVPAFHVTPFTVRFAEPDEADSVRVIPAQ